MASRRDWFRRHALLVTLATLAYVPLLLTAPGKVPGDTKLYLYSNPWRLMSDAVFSWDARQFGGWVPHQNVGYLWPSGPWFGLFDLVRVPDWIAHRLWIGSLLFIAGAGIVHLGRRLQLPTSTIAVAAFVYQLSPFVLPYVSRTSALLLPWALLGWLVAVTIRFTHDRRLGDLALFAFLIFSSGGLNATALLMIAPAPVAIILDALWRRRITIRRAMSTTLILGATSLVMSAWWLAGLVVQGRYGSAVLSYTEALPSTSATSTAPEVLRGLGYWLFYDRNDVVPLTSASNPYQTNVTVVLVGFAIVLIGLGGLSRLRSDVRRPLAFMLFSGLILAVGAFPYSAPNPIWSLLVDRPQSALSLALRSSTRAVPLVIIGIAFGCGWAVETLRRAWATTSDSRARWSRALVPLSLVVALLNLPALWTGRMVDPVMERPENLPAAWTDAAKLLDRRYDEGHTGSVLILPGIESAAFRWGYPVDSILPGISKKPMLNRDWVPQGSAPYMDLLYALDDSFQNGTASPESIAPIARLLGADTVMVVNSYQYERFDLDPPERAAALIDSAPGLERLADFGPPTVNVAPGEQRTDAEPLPEIVLYAVDQPTIGTRVTDSPILVSGDGTSLVDLAASGLIDGRSIVLASAALDADELDDALGAATELIVTDGNRKRAHHWRGSQNVWGATETAEDASDDEFDNRLPIFPDRNGWPITQSLVDTSSGLSVTATGYGALLAYYPEYRPAMAADDDPSTSWLVGWGRDPVGQILELRRVARPISMLRLLPAEHPNGVRQITRASVSLDDETWTDIDLSAPDGVVALPRPAEDVRLRIDAVAGGDTRSPSGWAEVLPSGDGHPEFITTPTDAVDVVGASTPVSYHFARWRTDDTDPERTDPERSIRRIFHVEHADGFVVSAIARENGAGKIESSDDCRDDLLTIDFEPVAMRILAVNDSEIRLQACVPVALEPGSRILESAADAPIVIDRITLRSSRATETAPAEIVATSIGRTSRAALVPACASTRCWIESIDGWNVGWTADLDDQELASPIASAAGRGTWTYSVSESARFTSTWTPQRTMWIGLLASLLGIAVAVAVLLVAPWRRRAIGSSPDSEDARSWRPSAIGESIMIAIALCAFVNPFAGLVTATVHYFIRERRRTTTFVCLLLVSVGYAYIVVQQVRYSTPAGFGWPGVYSKVHGVVLLATVYFMVRCAFDSSDESDSLSPS